MIRALLLPLLVFAAAPALADDIDPCVPGPGALRPVLEKKNGKKVTEGSLRGNARDGRWTFYWPSGHKKEQSFYCGGDLHGTSTYWYDNGLPELEGTFNRGLPWGTWTHWTPDGQRKTFRPVPTRREGGFFLDEGNRALARGELDLADSLLLIALRQTAEKAAVHRSLGILNAKKGEGAKAAFHYRRYLELDPQAKDRTQVERMLASYEAAKARAAEAPPTPAPPKGAPVASTPAPTAPVGPADAPRTELAPAVVEQTVRLEVITLPAASVVVDGVRHPFFTPLDGKRALKLTPGRHRLVLEVASDPPVVQHLEVTVTADDPANRVEFIPGERLDTTGAVKVRPLAPGE